jgi:hypothetical protein
MDLLAISLQFFPTAEESIDYYNQKRCFDGKGLVLPSQIVSLSFLCDESLISYLLPSFFIILSFFSEVCQIFRTYSNILQWGMPSWS